MKTFNEKWMEDVNPDLLVRFWRKKGSPSPLTVRNEFGVKIQYIRYGWGEFHFMLHPILEQRGYSMVN